jgi:hypothetical protein
MDLNSYIADNAGYAISTFTRAKLLAETLKSVVESLDPECDLDAALENIFGEPSNAQNERDNIALRLERAAQAALSLAADLRAHQVDERNSDKIGYDAAHSIIK